MNELISVEKEESKRKNHNETTGNEFKKSPDISRGMIVF